MVMILHLQFSPDLNQDPVSVQSCQPTPTISSLRNPKLKLKCSPSPPTTTSMSIINQMKTLNQTQTTSRTKTSCSLAMKTRRIPLSPSQDRHNPRQGQLHRHLPEPRQPHSQCSRPQDQ